MVALVTATPFKDAKTPLNNLSVSLVLTGDMNTDATIIGQCVRLATSFAIAEDIRMKAPFFVRVTYHGTADDKTDETDET